MSSLLKFNFSSLTTKNRPIYFYIAITDLTILVIYFLIFHFNKHIHYGSDVIYNSTKSNPEYLDLSKCHAIITITRNNHILVDESYYNLSTFKELVSLWNLHGNKFVIIVCENNSNLQDMFDVMDTIADCNIEKVYISNTSEINRMP